MLFTALRTQPDFPGPFAGENALVICADANPDEDQELQDLLALLQDHYPKVHLTYTTTVSAAVAQLREPFDMVWLRLPVPDLQAHLFIAALLGTADLAQRAGIVDPLSAQTHVIGPLLTKSQLTVEKWIWFRLRTLDEREWLGRLLKDCARSIETPRG